MGERGRRPMEASRVHPNTVMRAGERENGREENKERERKGGREKQGGWQASNGG